MPFGHLVQIKLHQIPTTTFPTQLGLVQNLKLGFGTSPMDLLSPIPPAWDSLLSYLSGNSKSRPPRDSRPALSLPRTPSLLQNSMSISTSKFTGGRVLRLNPNTLGGFLERDDTRQSLEMVSVCGGANPYVSAKPGSTTSLYSHGNLPIMICLTQGLMVTIQ